MSQIPSKPLLIEAHYLPGISWFALAADYTEVWLDVSSHHEKGSYRNRSLILSANGVQRLSVPLEHGRGQKLLTQDLRISYAEDWQKNHWQSICSAYRRSPFFEYFADFVEPFYVRRYPFLIDLQQEMLISLSKLLSRPLRLSLTTAYVPPGDARFDDRRNAIHPQINNPLQKNWVPYTQVFSDRYTFIPDLSIIDAIFNKGKFELKDLYT